MMGATFSMPAVIFNRSSTRSPRHQSATASGTWLSRDEATWGGREEGERGARSRGEGEGEGEGDGEKKKWGYHRSVYTTRVSQC